MGNVTLAMAVAPALGPAVSGVLLQLGSWRWIFAVVVPIAAGMLVIGLRKLVNVGEPKPGAIDWISVVLAALGFGTFVYGLSQIGVDTRDRRLPAVRRPWSSACSSSGVRVASAAAAAHRTPLLDLRTLGHASSRSRWRDVPGLHGADGRR